MRSFQSLYYASIFSDRGIAIRIHLSHKIDFSVDIFRMCIINVTFFLILTQKCNLSDQKTDITNYGFYKIMAI